MTKPSRKDVMRPYEYLSIAGVLAVFSALITLMATRDPLVTVIAFGVVFIIALMSLALLALAIKPDDNELTDLDDQNREQGPRLH